MVDSFGSWRRSSRRTVSPPTPESNTPIARSAPAFTRGLAALLLDERVGERVDRLRHGGVRGRQNERLLLVQRLGHGLPVGRDLADNGKIERVLDAALRHACRAIRLIYDEKDRDPSLVAERLERVDRGTRVRDRGLQVSDDEQDDVRDVEHRERFFAEPPFGEKHTIIRPLRRMSGLPTASAVASSFAPPGSTKTASIP